MMPQQPPEPYNISASRAAFRSLPSFQVLVRLCQWINFGRMVSLAFRDGQPVFNPEPTVLVDVKLGDEDGARPEADLEDFHP